MRSRRSLRLLPLLAAALLVSASPALGAGDDYPAEYRNADPINDSTRWGYAPRGTPSFIAWRLEQHGIRVSANNGWGLFIQSGLTVPVMQEMLAPGLGARIDQTPAPEAIALWPGAMAGWNVTEWVAAVNPDGSTVTESYFTNTGYMSRTIWSEERAPWYIHLPGSLPVGGVAGGPSGAPVPAPPPSTSPPAPPVAPPPPPPTSRSGGRQMIQVFAFSRHQLTLRTHLDRPRLVTLTITGKGRTAKIRRVIIAGTRLVKVKVRPKLPQGVYTVTLVSPADGTGPALTLRARGRKTA